MEKLRIDRDSFLKEFESRFEANLKKSFGETFDYFQGLQKKEEKKKGREIICDKYFSSSSRRDDIRKIVQQMMDKKQKPFDLDIFTLNQLKENENLKMHSYNILANVISRMGIFKHCQIEDLSGNRPCVWVWRNIVKHKALSYRELSDIFNFGRRKKEDFGARV